MGGIIKIIKDIFTFILFILIILLTYIQGLFMYGGYEPTGNFYDKTSPSSGDAGISDVIDFELEEREYKVGEVIKAKIGFGTKRDTPIVESFSLSLEFYDISDYENPYAVNTISYENELKYDNYPVYEEKSYLDFLGHYWYWYPDFYPTYHEDVEFVIPDNTTTGRLFIELHCTYYDEYDDTYYEASLLYLMIGYEVVDDTVSFH